MARRSSGDKGYPGPELHLRPMLVEEALYNLGRYLDQVFLSGMTTVRIVHGKGTGVLRDAVRDSLATHPLVNGYREGYMGEGGAGVTVVNMANMGNNEALR